VEIGTDASTTTDSGSTTIYLGTIGTSRDFLGGLDDFRYYSRALSGADVLELVALGVSPQPARSAHQFRQR
jgi:hypothetical protein